MKSRTPRPPVVVGCHRGEAEALPDEGDDRDRNKAEERSASAHDGTEITAERCRDNGCQGVTAIENS